MGIRNSFAYDKIMSYPEMGFLSDNQKIFKIKKMIAANPLTSDDEPLPQWAVKLLLLSAIGYKARIRAAIIHHIELTGEKCGAKKLIGFDGVGVPISKMDERQVHIKRLVSETDMQDETGESQSPFKEAAETAKRGDDYLDNIYEGHPEDGEPL